MLNWSRYCALAVMEANGMLSCISKSVAARLRGVTIALDEAVPGIMLCPVFGPSASKVGTNWREPRRGLLR